MRKARTIGGVVRRPPDGGPAVRLRTLRRGRGGRETPIAVNLAPMIDVTFLLLIFFLVTTTFERAEGILTSDLPRSRGIPTVALPVRSLVSVTTNVNVSV